MGVTIHYSGQLPNMSRLPPLVTAIQESARQRDWAYRLVDERILGTADILVQQAPGPTETWRLDDGTEIEVQDMQFDYQTYQVDDRWRGIIVSPPDCEPVWLTFSRDGRLISYQASEESYKKPGHYLAVTSLSTKTQFAGAIAHIGVCELLLLSKAHGVEMEVLDEGEYWETGDRQRLEQRMGFLDAAMRMVGEQAGQIIGDVLGEDAVGRDPKVEIGKQVTRPLPDWRRDWGLSAHEN